ncbi:hypothetical protein [Polynucleobacter asymbioticus]|nr:hypothetical protein [Polynucleobacter asymbioticus]
MMTTKFCSNCCNLFIARPQSPDQEFCSDGPCQKERRKRWRQKKMEGDSDYRLNQSRAQRAWLDRNPDYWREYRKNKGVKRGSKPIRDQINVEQPLSGLYQIRFIPNNRAAKSDAWIVEITPVDSI